MSSRKIQQFTLFEVIIAIAVFAMVATASALVLQSMQRSWQKVSQKSIRLRQKQVIDQVVNTAFKNAIPFSWKDDNFKKRLVFDGRPDSVILGYLHRINAHEQSGIRFLKLFLEDDKLIALYRNTPILPWLENEDGVTREILAEKVERISFLYADINPDTNAVLLGDEWDPENTSYIPLGIQIKIEWQDGSSDVWFRRTAGAGYCLSLGNRRYNR